MMIERGREMGEMRILTSYKKEEILAQFPNSMKRAGDSKVVFDPENEDEVKVAKEQFNSLIKKKFTCYSVGKDGEKDKKVTKFDPKAAMYIFVPPIIGG
jgi:hypothetical protein